MTKPIVRDPIYRRRRFDAEIIDLCVRWYITYRLSYRDLVAMMAERGITVSHTTIHRWVIRYVPEFEKRWNRFARPVNSSWRVDETYVRVRGKWNFLYRGVDKHGKTVDFLLRPDRGIAAAQAFFRKALSRCLPQWPRKITLDGHQQSHWRFGICGARIRSGSSFRSGLANTSTTSLSRITERSNADALLWGGLQVLRDCGNYAGRHRACPSNSQAAILARARSISELRVAQADLGTSTRVELRPGSKTFRFGPESFRDSNFERL
jgi:transposase-like protein